MFKTGDKVTWGSGEPTAVVADVFKSFNVDIGAQDVFALVRLTKEVSSPCGRTFPAGLEAKLPTAELRLLY